VLAWLLLSGEFVSFIRVGLWPLLAGGLLLMLLFFLAMLIRLIRSEPVEGNIAGRWMSAAIILLPLVYIAGTPSSGLDSHALAKRSLGLEGGRAEYQAGAERLKIPADSTINLNLSELLRYADNLGGVQVITVGRVFEPEDLQDDLFGLYRFVVTCCAADARPAQVLVRSPLAEELEVDSWLQVTGVPVIEEVAGMRLVVIESAAIREIDPPDVPYLYHEPGGTHEGHQH
jgi:uncharacterized repeat protein (TIGR03943 family)